MATQVADFSEINPHLALLASESYVSPDEVRWYAFVRAAEAKLKHGLDGNQQADGFSLDYAHDFFADGATVAEYVEEVRLDKAELDSAFGPLLSLPSRSRF
jgi:hypothetical protein